MDNVCNGESLHCVHNSCVESPLPFVYNACNGAFWLRSLKRRKPEMIKRLFAILLVLAMLCTVLAAAAEDAAEGTQQETAVETATEETQEAASEEAAEEVTEEATEAAPPILLLTAYGEEITDQSNDLVSFINDYLSYLSQYGYDVSSPEIQSYIMASSLEYLLEQKVAMHKAADLGLDEISAEERATIEADTASTWEEEIAYYMENYYGITEDSSEEESTQARTEILSALEEQGYTLETVTAQALEQEVISRVEGSVIDQVSATDEDILQYYDELVSEGKEAAEEDLQSYISSFDMAMTYPGYFEPVYYIPEGYRSVIHILLTPDTELLENWKGLSAKLEEAGEETEATGSGESAETDAPEETEEPVTEEMVEAARQAIFDSEKEKIDDIMSRLDKGESFESLIAEYGQDTGMQDEDLLKNGYMIHALSSSYDPVFAEAAMGLEKVGDISEPVLGQYGIHIIYYLKDIEAGGVELTDSLRADLKLELDTQMKNAAYAEAIESWKQEAITAGDVVITEDGQSWLAPLSPADETAETEEAPAGEDAASEEAPAEESTTAEEAPAETPAP